MRRFAGKNVSRVIDLLNERLAFERSGVALYGIEHVIQRDPRLANDFHALLTMLTSRSSSTMVPLWRAPSPDPFASGWYRRSSR